MTLLLVFFNHRKLVSHRIFVNIPMHTPYFHSQWHHQRAKSNHVLVERLYECLHFELWHPPLLHRFKRLQPSRLPTLQMLDARGAAGGAQNVVTE